MHPILSPSFLLLQTANICAKLLDRDASLHFALLRLQLIELIRKAIATPDGDITPALTFATTNLAPRAPTNPQFLEDLERAMSLLIFPPDNLAPPLAALLNPTLREDIAQRVNEALLASQGERTRATLYDLVNHRSWANQKAIEAKKDHFPGTIDLGLTANDGPEESHSSPPAQPHSGQDDSMTTGSWQQY